MTSTITDRLNGLTTSVAVKAPCRVASTAAITLSGEQTIDSVSVVAGDRVLVKDQTDSSENGIYVCGTSTWTRATDFDGTFDAVGGTSIFVSQGTTYASSHWRVDGSGEIVIGTDDITFTVYLPDATHAYVRPEQFGAGQSASEINDAIEYASDNGSLGVLVSAGTWTIDETVILKSNVPLIGNPNGTVYQRGSGFVGTMFQSEDFATYTGTTDATAAYPRHIGMIGGRVDGRYMNDAFTSYVETSGGNGIEIYAHKIELELTVQNIPGIGVWLESSTGNGNLDLDYPRKGRVNLIIQATKYEGLVYKGPADQIIERLYCTNAGARIASEQDTGLVSSPTYGGSNGGYTDGIVFDTGCEVPGVIHSWGHYTGRGIVINDGRFNVFMMMAETCRYGAVRILGDSYGKIENLEIHRAGGYNSDTQPMLDYDAAGSDNILWNINAKIYHNNSANTTARNLVEIGSNARYLYGRFDLNGDNVPGHGLVIDGAATFINLDVYIVKCNGTAADALAASAIYRSASFDTRGFRITGYVQNCDVAFRSSGTPDAETIELTCDLSSGQALFAGDARANQGQVWKITGDIDGTPATMWPKAAMQTSLTIASGAVTYPDNSDLRIDTESAASTDDLDTISGGVIGDIVTISPATGTRTVVAKHGTGNLSLDGLADFTMDSGADKLVLQRHANAWVEISRSDNGT